MYSNSITNYSYGISTQGVVGNVANAVNSVATDPNINKLINNFLYQNPNQDFDNSSLFNPANPFSPNGVIGRMGQERYDNPAKDMYTDVRDVQKSLSNSKNKNQDNFTNDPFRSSPTNDFTDNLNKAMAEVKERSLEHQTEMFSSIPRLNAVYGTFVRPPSKVSINQLYNATLEAVLGSVIQVVKATITAEFRKYSHENKKIEDLISKTLNKLGGDDFFYRVCDYLITGNAVGEILWETTDKGYATISSVTWCPPTNIQYQVDWKGKVIGALQPALMARSTGMFEGVCKDEEESQFAIREIIPSLLPFFLVPRENLFYIAVDNDFNPYGLSPVRRAYIFYEIKKILLKQYTIAMSRNSVPTMVAYFDKNMVSDANDIEYMKQSLSQMSVGGIAFIPTAKGNGMEVDVVKMDSGGIGAFKEALSYCDSMMKMSFLGELVTSEAGSYSNGFINKETFRDNLLPHINRVSKAVYDQVIQPMIKENFPKEHKECKFGEFLPSNISNTEKLEVTKQFEIGVSCGLIDPANLYQVNSYLTSMGLPIYNSEAELPAIKNPNMFEKGGGSSRGTNPREGKEDQPYSNHDNPQKA